ncbi:MAG: DNA-processing protein DprA [Planctomycetota bacterium]|jgi:DNA processing protein
MPVLPDDIPESTLRVLLAGGLGPVTLARLRERFGSDGAIATASRRDLRTVPGIGDQRARSIANELRTATTSNERRVMRDAGAVLILEQDEHYPPLLRGLPAAPPALWVTGSLRHVDGEHDEAIAIVGARRCSTYGRSQAAHFARVLAECGLTIVSGGAIGIDAEAHRAALRAGGHTIAVLGSGLARPHPRSHAGLFAAMVDAGSAVVSEFPMTTAPRPALFPRRNRVISGLSRGVVVVEAGRRSGALLTAGCAVEQHGRDAMVIPGPVDAPGSAGCNAALREAWAAPVLEPLHVLEQIGGIGCRAARRAEAIGGAASAPAQVASFVEATSPAGRRILEALPADGSGMDIDTLAAAADIEIVPCLVEITRLEVAGLLGRTPGLVHRRRA